MLLEDIKLNMRTARAARSARTSSAISEPKPRTKFGAWRAQRPFVGAILTIVAGFELFFSGQLDVGNIHIQVGIEGLQSTIIPVVMVTLGLLTMLMPVHRIFYGVITLALAVYSIIGLNLGGFFIGMLLGAVGGILSVSWIPKKSTAEAEESLPSEETVTRASTREGTATSRPLVHSR